MKGTEINTKEILSKWEKEIKEAIEKLSERRVTPKLNIVQVGNAEDSTMYINTKLNVGKRLGIEVNVKNFDYSVTTQELERYILTNRLDPIIVQLPLPEHIDVNKVIDAIPYDVDVDGFTVKQQGLLSNNDDRALIPATALGVMRILKEAVGDITATKVCIINRSHLIGKPLIQTLLNENAYVTILHSKITDKVTVVNETTSSDIVITGCGKRKLFGPEYFEGGQVLIDCSMHREDGIKDVGDMDKEAILEEHNVKIASGYGHTGPATVMALMSNVVKSYTDRHKRCFM